MAEYMFACMAHIICPYGSKPLTLKYGFLKRKPVSFCGSKHSQTVRSWTWL